MEQLWHKLCKYFTVFITKKNTKISTTKNCTEISQIQISNFRMPIYHNCEACKKIITKILHIFTYANTSQFWWMQNNYHKYLKCSIFPQVSILDASVESLHVAKFKVPFLFQSQYIRMMNAKEKYHTNIWNVQYFHKCQYITILMNAKEITQIFEIFNISTNVNIGCAPEESLHVAKFKVPFLFQTFVNISTEFLSLEKSHFNNILFYAIIFSIKFSFFANKIKIWRTSISASSALCGSWKKSENVQLWIIISPLIFIKKSWNFVQLWGVEISRSQLGAAMCAHNCVRHFELCAAMCAHNCDTRQSWRLVTFETLFAIPTIENLNSWQPLLPDN